MESSDLGKHSRTHSCLFSICDNIVSEVLKTHTAVPPTAVKSCDITMQPVQRKHVIWTPARPPTLKNDTDTWKRSQIWQMFTPVYVSLMSVSCARPENCRLSPRRRFDTIIHLLRVIPHESPPPPFFNLLLLYFSVTICYPAKNVWFLLMSEPLSPPGTINEEALSVTIYLRLRRDALLIQGRFFFFEGGVPWLHSVYWRS